MSDIRNFAAQKHDFYRIMRKILLCLFSLLLMIPAIAQQSQETKRINRAVIYPEFRHAKILQTFGRYVMGDVNIYVKDASLLFIDKDKTVRQVANKNIIGVQFDDTTKYLRVDDTAMGLVLAESKSNALLCVTVLDEEKHKTETLSFADIDLGTTNVLVELNTDNEGRLGVPLKDTFYFSIKGRIVQANETNLKKEIRPEMKKEFRELMEDRWWSWKDPNNLKDILRFLP